ncbi:ISAs1-like element ISVsp7 family transposase [Verrucomicrobium spinosum]|uniref:ISAs1-like element ISVsp7 family transposase n=1 Tax=Verrucomicrobium spinosum TaxID=2736 RepID=UPI0006A6CA39|nr:ISAs1-like element ISVsp7 family transposase [Verrucomicrobium spinosum]
MTHSLPPQGTLEALRAKFAQIHDPRQAGKVRHRIDEVLIIAFCSTLCDGESYLDMGDFAQSQLSWLQSFLPLKHGAPSHDVFRNVLMAIQPQALLEVLTGWCGDLEGRHIAIDGKALRGTHNAETGRHLVHLLRAWVDDYHLSAGQITCHEKSNEIEAIPRLLESLQLKGATVTIDAMGTQAHIAEQITGAGADYVLALKANHPRAHETVRKHFTEAERLDLSPSHHRKSVTLELSHGRCERREYTITEELDWYHKSWKWAGLQSVAQVRRQVQRSHDGPPLEEVHYFLCSFKADVERLAKLVRGHWSVENRCHWVLDVTFNEDHCQVRDRNAAHNLTILREMVIPTLHRHPAKVSLRRKRKLATMDPAFRLQMLGLLHA